MGMSLRALGGDRPSARHLFLAQRAVHPMHDDISLHGLARQMVLAGLIDEKTVLQAQRQAQRNQTPLVTWLVQNKLVKSRGLAELAAEQFGIALFDLGTLERENQPRDLLSEKLIRQHRALPLWRRGNRLFVAISDPTNHEAIREIRFGTGLNTEAILVEDDRLGEAMEKYFEGADTALDDLADAGLDGSISKPATGMTKRSIRPEMPKMRRWCASSTRYCWMRSAAAPRICTSNPTRRATGCVFAPTASSMRWPGRPSGRRRRSPRA